MFVNFHVSVTVIVLLLARSKSESSMKDGLTVAFRYLGPRPIFVIVNTCIIPIHPIHRENIVDLFPFALASTRATRAC